MDKALGNIGEFGLIDLISRQFKVPEGVTGIGDDCAVIPQREGFDTLISTDMLVEGSHFIPGRISPEDLGWKSAAVNLSDIAAMGGRPDGTFLSIAVPKGTDVGWLERFISGYRQLSERFSCPLLGGDTTSSPDRICINVTVTGSVPSGRALRRDAAREGDLICVTGCLGDSALGLRMLLDGSTGHPDYRYFTSRHCRPLPRVEEGMALARTPGVHAMLDISDGLGSDLRHILEASGKGAVVECSAVPFSAQLRAYCSEHGLDPLEPALCGGEDYELLFTVDAGSESSIPVEHRVIGRITEPGEGLVWKGSDRDFLGFRHF